MGYPAGRERWDSANDRTNAGRSQGRRTRSCRTCRAVYDEPASDVDLDITAGDSSCTVSSARYSHYTLAIYS